MDGVLYLGETPIPQAAETVAALQNSGQKVYFLTNNSGRTRSAYRDKLARINIVTDDDHIFTSAYATALMLKSQGAVGKTAFIIGEFGIAEELSSIGISVVTVPDSILYTQIDYVVVGIDRAFTYDKLRFAHAAITRGHAKFIATNRDATFPVEEGEIPGSGSIVISIATSTGIEPMVIGKPETHSLELLLSAANSTPDQTVVIGDRLDTDIECGNRLGARTDLALTGVSKLEDVAVAPSIQIPGYIVGSISEILEDDLWSQPVSRH